MSVRKVYSVYVNGKEVYHGSYNSCLCCYESLCNAADLLNPDQQFDVVIAFRPELVSKGGSLNV